jgi:hypothetical protein
MIDTKAMRENAKAARDAANHQCKYMAATPTIQRKLIHSDIPALANYIEQLCDEVERLSEYEFMYKSLEK